MTSLIREFTATDLPACAVLLADVFNAPPWNESWDPESAGQRLGDLAATPNFVGLVAEDPSGIVALAFGHSQRYQNEWHFQLVELCVANHRQGEGIAKALVSKLHDRLQATGVHRIYILTARDTPAQAFYESSGFYVSPKMILMARRY